MVIEYTNILHFKGPPKFTPIRMFGEKMNHLATLFSCCRGQESEEYPCANESLATEAAPEWGSRQSGEGSGDDSTKICELTGTVSKVFLATKNVFWGRGV
jgi:hypothetical protein